MIDITPTENFPKSYWGLNCPLQMWGDAKSGWRVVNYMPRRETCGELDERITEKEMPQFCKNTASILRNLADLFDAMADGKIDYIYYPDKSIAEAIADAEKDRKEETK